MLKQGRSKGREEALFSFLSKFMDLTEREMSALLELDIFKQYGKGAMLFREGDFTRQYYLVIKGCIRSYYIANGYENTIEFHTELESYAPQAPLREPLPS